MELNNCASNKYVGTVVTGKNILSSVGQSLANKCAKWSSIR
jgi:hypothetical protein